MTAMWVGSPRTAGAPDTAATAPVTTITVAVAARKVARLSLIGTP